jgi:hypothetical protein
VVSIATEAVEPTAATATEVVDNVASDAVTAVEPDVEAVTTAVAASVAGETEPTLAASSAPTGVPGDLIEAGDAIVPAATAVVGSAAESVIDTIAGPAESTPVEGASAAVSIDDVAAAVPLLASPSAEEDVVASGGTIEVTGSLAADAASDDLYAEGGYTDYGIALATAPPAEAATADEPGDPPGETPAPELGEHSEESQEATLPQAAGDTADGGILPASADLSSTLDDLGFR